jgi:imidazolonepropionase-like amidohydrolase
VIGLRFPRRTRRRIASLIAGLGAILGVAPVDGAETPAPSAKLVLAGVLLGSGSAPVKDAAVLIEGDRIKEVGPRSRVTAPAGATTIDLGKFTVLPGLIDAHTHILLQGDPTVASYEDQILRESQALRTIRGTVAAGIALRHGFTTLRDLETEGAMYADVSIKQAIERRYIDGPRLVVATRALASTGAYPLLGFPYEITVPTGVQVCDGPDACRQAVREQIKYGADWIKLYADRSYFIAKDGHLDALPNFTQTEVDAIVEQAHAWRKKVAAHAMTRAGIGMALKAGVDSIEHGDSLEEDHARQMAARGTYYCPTLTVTEYVAAPRAAEGRGIWAKIPAIVHESFRRARSMGVKIVFGTDAGGFPWDEVNQAREFSYMVSLGMSPEEAIRAATIIPAEMMDMGDDVGGVTAGRYADLVAVDGDPLREVKVLEDVRFVMLGGRVIRDELTSGRVGAR